MLAEEQARCSGKTLVSFERRHGLNTSETARLFDVTERTVQNLRKSETLPTQFCIALRVLDRDPTAFAAHYRPVAVNPRGRPKTVERAGS
jgi:hypothetical protein